MGKSNDCPDEGWSEAGAAWLESLPFEDVTDLFWMADNGPDNDKDVETLERLADSYAEATGWEGEPTEDNGHEGDADGSTER